MSTKANEIMWLRFNRVAKRQRRLRAADRAIGLLLIAFTALSLTIAAL